MPIGVAPFSVRHNVFNKNQVEEAYKKLQEIGFDGLEGGLGFRYNRCTLEEEVALLKKYNLRICDVKGDLSKPDEVMKMADALGAKYLWVDTLQGEMMRSIDGFKAFADQLNNLAKPFKAHGFKLIYHNHAQEFRNFAELDGKPAMEILLDETDPDGVCFLLDTFWCSAAGADPAYWLKRIKGRSGPIVHFKEYAIDDRSYDIGIEDIPFRFAEIGQGNINWPAVMEACKEIGIEWYCIEQDLCRGDIYGSLKISVDFMRNKLNIK